MATKIKLGERPKSFDKTVEFPMLDGSVGCIPVSYAYRTRKELAEMTDEVQSVAKAAEEADIEVVKAKLERKELIEPMKQVEITDREMSLQVDYIMKAVIGWGLDVKFERSAVEQLVDEVPAAIPALVEGYRSAINQGRLGN